jgi:hypothetical protein
MRNAYRILVGKLGGKGLGRHVHGWVIILKWILNEVGRSGLN